MSARTLIDVLDVLIERIRPCEPNSPRLLAVIDLAYQLGLIEAVNAWLVLHDPKRTDHERYAAALHLTHLLATTPSEGPDGRPAFWRGEMELARAALDQLVEAPMLSAEVLADKIVTILDPDDITPAHIRRQIVRDFLPVAGDQLVSTLGTNTAGGNA